AALVAPAWRPGPGRVLAYSDGREAVVVDADTGAVLRRLTPKPTKLAWSRDGRLLLVFSPSKTRVYDGRRVVAADDPSEATVDRDATFAGRNDIVAARAAGYGSSVFSLVSGRTFFRGTGVFDQLASLADGEPVGLRPCAPAEDRRGRPHHAAVRAQRAHRRLVLRVA